MYRIAVLLTCFNRKEKTLASLKCLLKAHFSVKEQIDINIYLTDDGSTDGTGDAVRKEFPEVTVLKGNGELYWAGGMRNSWTKALCGEYNAYLLLNDDTEVFESFLKELVQTHEYCLNTYGESGIYIGSTINPITQKLSYGGSVLLNRFMAKSIRLEPNGNTPQKCELGNANIMLVTQEVVDKIGILADGFIHGLADYDYTLTANKNGIPVLVTPNFLGECLNDNKNPYDTFHNLSVKERIAVLNSPIGLDFKSNLEYMRRNFPYRLPLVYLTGWFKVLFPKLYQFRFR